MDHKIEYGQAGEKSTLDSIEMPAPTLLPLVLALGLMLAFFGVIFQAYLIYLGLAISLIAAFGWWRQVIPTEAHEEVALDLKHRPSGVALSTVQVARLSAGSAGHNMEVAGEAREYSAGVLGGLVGGAFMAVLACLYGLFAHHSIWFPINLLAGVVMPSVGNQTVEQLSAFNGGAFTAALIGHVGLSILVGVLYAVTLPMFPKYAPFWAGFLMPLVWTGLVATILNLINPTLNGLINWPWYLVCQLGFGLACGFVVARSEKINTLEGTGFAERAHLETPLRPNKGQKL